MRVLSVIPPMTQLNTPYPSTAYLTGFLRSRGVVAVQEDLALALVLRLLSQDSLLAVRECIAALPVQRRTPRVQAFERAFDRYLATIGPAVAFLQGRDPSIGHRIGGRNFLPEGPRFEPLDAYVDAHGGDPLAWAFGALGVQDRAPAGRPPRARWWRDNDRRPARRPAPAACAAAAARPRCTRARPAGRPPTPAAGPAPGPGLPAPRRRRANAGNRSGRPSTDRACSTASSAGSRRARVAACRSCQTDSRSSGPSFLALLTRVLTGSARMPSAGAGASHWPSAPTSRYAGSSQASNCLAASSTGMRS